LPRGFSGAPGRSAGSFDPPLFGLAPGGVYQASASRRSWWSLTPPFQLSHAPRVLGAGFWVLAGALPTDTPLRAKHLRTDLAQSPPPCTANASPLQPHCGNWQPNTGHLTPITREARGFLFCGTFRIPNDLPIAIGTPSGTVAAGNHLALWSPDFPPRFLGAITRLARLHVTTGRPIHQGSSIGNGDRHLSRRRV